MRVLGGWSWVLQDPGQPEAVVDAQKLEPFPQDPASPPFRVGRDRKDYFGDH